MTPRPTPIAIRDGYPWMTVELEGHGVHQMCIPSGLAVAQLLQALDQAHLLALASVGAPDDVTPSQLLVLLKDAGPELLSGLGALIGLAWSHQVHELETPSCRPGESLIDYGALVYEELHAAGYRLEAFVMLGITIIRAIWDQSQFTQEVGLRAAFFSHLGATVNSHGSTLGSSTSGTPGASID